MAAVVGLQIVLQYGEHDKSKEWAIWEALVLRAGRIVSKSELEVLVLGFESELMSNSIEVHVFKLRSKLGKTSIETIRGLGYRIAAA